MNRSDASIILAPTAARGVATMRAPATGMTTITITITTPPAGTG